MQAVAVKGMARVLVASVLLSAPFALTAHGLCWLVGPITHNAVALLVRVTAPLTAAARVEPETAPETAELSLSTPSELSLDAVTKSPLRRGAKPLPKTKPTALFVPGATVL